MKPPSFLIHHHLHVFSLVCVTIMMVSYWRMLWHVPERRSPFFRSHSFGVETVKGNSEIQSSEKYEERTATTEYASEFAKWNGKAFLLETIPLDAPLLQPIQGTRDTWEVQMEYIRGAQRTIDFWAMYWTLTTDMDDYTPEQKKRWGTQRGQLLYKELQNAAQRGVQIRIVSELRLYNIRELQDLQQKYPNQISYRLWNASEWYEYGMMHIKGWVFDDNRAMITDANTDWRSFSQVKEVGVAFEGLPGFQAVDDLQRYFDRWWAWTDPALKQSLGNQSLTKPIVDPYLQHTRLVPCFSEFGQRINNSVSCDSPFSPSSSTVFNASNPMALILNDTIGNTYFTCSPPEVCDTPDAAYPQERKDLDGRTWDGQALIETILSAREQICLSTMYFIPAALTLFSPDAPLWWPALIDVLLLKVSQGVNVRILISQWTDAYTTMPGYFRALQSTAEANAVWAKNPGTMEVKYFALPGWENATGPNDAYPQYARVNHGKYIVTDNRFNIGTNEMEWSFFFNTAGTSFNSDHPLLRRQLQAVFDRDWNSAYAIPLPPS